MCAHRWVRCSPAPIVPGVVVLLPRLLFPLTQLQLLLPLWEITTVRVVLIASLSAAQPRGSGAPPVAIAFASSASVLSPPNHTADSLKSGSGCRYCTQGDLRAAVRVRLTSSAILRYECAQSLLVELCSCFGLTFGYRYGRHCRRALRIRLLAEAARAYVWERVGLCWVVCDYAIARQLSVPMSRIGWTQNEPDDGSKEVVRASPYGQ